MCYFICIVYNIIVTRLIKVHFMAKSYSQILQAFGSKKKESLNTLPQGVQNAELIKSIQAPALTPDAELLKSLLNQKGLKYTPQS